MAKLDEAVWIGWKNRAEKEKKDAGRTDADLAAEIAEQLGYDVSRATVNHWFRGRRDPSLREFIALCGALGADPGYVLLNVRVSYTAIPKSEVAPALHDRAQTPDYLKKSAKKLRVAKRARQKVRA